MKRLRADDRVGEAAQVANPVDVSAVDVADTARWVATYRAAESRSQAPFFVDRYAEQVMGELGERMAADWDAEFGDGWYFKVRTSLVDAYILDTVWQHRIQTVVNLGAGYDTRPYRLSLPPTLRWVEIDHPDLIATKSELLIGAGEPHCILARFGCDITDFTALTQLLDQQLADKRVLFVAEGVLLYLEGKDVARLADLLSGAPDVAWWVSDVVSPVVIAASNLAAKRRGIDVRVHFGALRTERAFAKMGWRVDRKAGIVATAGNQGRFPAAITRLGSTLERMPVDANLVAHVVRLCSAKFADV